MVSKDYGNRVDPVSALGLDVDSVLCYRVENVVRAFNLPRPELLPYGYCVGDVDALHIWLKVRIVCCIVLYCILFFIIENLKFFDVGMI